SRKKYGFNVQWLTSEQIEKRYKLHKTYGGILSQQGGSMDAFQLAHDLLHFNSKKRLSVFDKTDIVNIEYRSKDVKIFTEYDNTITAKKVIFCNGYESTEMIPEKIVNLLSTFAVVGEQSESEISELSNTLFWNTADPYNYMRTTDDHRFLI